METLCRNCGKIVKDVFVDLGVMPLANSFLSEDLLLKDEPSYPLKAYVCSNCFLVQLEELANPLEIFSNYAYLSSYSDSWLEHARNYANMITDRFGLNSSYHVVEIASNDGYLLQYFKEKNIPVLGIEPAANVATIAQKKGIPTLTKFFGTNTAEELRKDGLQADLIVGNNVLAHVPNLHDFVAGLKILLKQKGIITMEFPHLLKLIQYNQFDTIYHEHFSYFSFFVVNEIFASHLLTIFDVEELPTHGGSLRIYAKHKDNNDLLVQPSVGKVLKEEKDHGLMNISTYMDFKGRINLLKKDICKFIEKARNEKRKIVCYGAPAKGNTLLNFCKINSDVIEYTVDRNPYKQGLFLPGTHIPIKNPSYIMQTKPDYLVILPWNLKDEIMSQMSHIKNWGGRFVVFIPEVTIYP